MTVVGRDREEVMDGNLHPAGAHRPPIRALSALSRKRKSSVTGSNTTVLGDVNGDGAADFRLVLASAAVSATDFVL
jgi:hypothetical protein